MADPADRLPDFWLSSGFQLLSSDGAGRLVPTDGFLAAYLDRPELRPVAESDARERALHARLRVEPRAAIGEADLATLGDPDIRDNYRFFLDFRDRLLGAGTLEAAYLELIKCGPMPIPPLFLDHLVHVLLRNILADCGDPIVLRAAELLYRSQRASILEGAVMLADEETVERSAQTDALGLLPVDNGRPIGEVVLDVLSADNAELYWTRSDRFDTVLDLTFARPGLDALARVLEAWIGHFLGVALRIEPVREIRDEHWSWHVGLDAESSSILNALYCGEPVDENRIARLVALFRGRFANPAEMRADLAGRPVYLALAIDAGSRLRLKPQNLLMNLPLAQAI